MVHKSIISMAAVAGLSVLAATAGMTTASAGGYGYGNNNAYYGGYNQRYQAPIVAPRAQVRDNWQQHVAWCYDRFASYSAEDNTYQPYNGPRQQCWSPYYRG